MSSSTDAGACREIARGVYYMEAGKGINRSNVYFVRSGPSWVLIDAASVNCGLLIRKAAERLFGTNARPASILLTHDHPDHTGAALELADAWNCAVYVHPDELPLAVNGNLSTFKQFANPLDRWIVFPLLHAMPPHKVASMISKASLKGVCRAYDLGNGVPGLPDWRCIPAPGHTPGQVVFFRHSDGVLITGDAILTVNLNSFPGFLLWGLRIKWQRVSGPPWYSTWNWRAARESVIALADLGPCVLASGYGIPMTGEEVARRLYALAEHFSGWLVFLFY